MNYLETMPTTENIEKTSLKIESADDITEENAKEFMDSIRKIPLKCENEEDFIRKNEDLENAISSFMNTQKNNIKEMDMYRLQQIIVGSGIPPDRVAETKFDTEDKLFANFMFNLYKELSEEPILIK